TSIGHPRSQLNAYAIPPRTHVRWELEVAFGNPDGRNDWTLTPSGTSPVLFWQIHSMNQHYPPLAANVDTDSSDPTKLMITFMQRVGTAASSTEICKIKGIPRHKMVPIVIDAFLDERSNSNGGKGFLQIWVDNTLAVEKAGPNLASGPNPHWWTFGVYLWNQKQAYNQTRAAFWKTAKMMVFPVSASTMADTTPPLVPGNLAATSDSSKANLSWRASTDNVGIAGYIIYRDGTEIGKSATTSYTDASVAAGATYNYTVKAYDAAGNISTSSNTVKVDRANATGISSY
ncbi:fibronectin type III domain-containing protein, partial [Methylobacter sp.]|uniref:fibronectin type III domain-containing protein n=1 Tax=Methylobacter sp. TaxID=2051955 RepID=UPI0025DA8D21